jgi:DNA-binding response OmpR family regulator
LWPPGWNTGRPSQSVRYCGEQVKNFENACAAIYFKKSYVILMEKGGLSMAATKILIADDGPVVHESLGIYLKSEGFEQIDVYDGISALKQIDNETALAVLDIMMPGMNGMDVCREIRKTSLLPVIMLTAKGEEVDRIIGLELGADDFIVKPFSPREVVARIKAVLRRVQEQPEDDSGACSYDGLTVDLKSYTVLLKGKPVVCTPKEIEILYMLASNPGQVFTREQLLNRIWGYEFIGETRTVDTHIKRIRAKLDNTGLKWNIKTIYGVGYKFEVEK